MSHTVVIESVDITSKSALKSAVRELIQQHGVKGELKENAKPKFPPGYGLGYDGSVCDYVLALADYQMDIGFKKVGRKYQPIIDNMMNYAPLRGKSKSRNDDGRVGKLLQMYAKHAAIEAAELDGHTVTDAYEDEEGNLKLKFAVA